MRSQAESDQSKSDGRDLTTLQVARRIADAVIAHTDEWSTQARSERDAEDGPTQAVLRVLHETGTWLSKWESELPAETAEPADEEPTLF